MALPHDATGLSAVCDCGISDNTNLTRTGPRSAAGNVSGYRCESDCRPGIASSILAWSHTFVEIDHEIISWVILLPSVESFMN